MTKSVLKLVVFLSLLVSFRVFGQQHLIPEPVNMTLQNRFLSLKNGVVIPGGLSPVEKDLLRRFFSDHQIKENQNSVSFKITIEPNSDLGKEGYELTIDSNGIRISAPTKVGVFYALQTLRQFDIKDKRIQFVRIKDYPALNWRGFLVDVGRNWQPMDLLKQQIDVMSHYKLNVFHFHFTEDIAWRLQSKLYPGLTAASNMTRWKGKYYTQAEFQELIDYCEARHILFLPEIDMPGHSDAFTRFFGVDMQSEKGIFYIKQLLKEFHDTYPTLKILHIGGDEVKISNKNFMPEITAYVEQLGYNKTIGWHPGSNLSPETVEQLWMGGPTPIPDSGEFIDSKHLYLNHMDPEETVTTLFFRKLGDTGHSTKNLLGAELCSWPDRAVAKPIDMFTQNAIYPGILTFAERSWRGGGQNPWVCNLPMGNTHDLTKFKNFETRLLFHKNKYFKDLPFPYVKQTQMQWQLVGPFDNHGDLSKSFPIEKDPFSSIFPTNVNAVGGTVILRHWWAPLLQGAINDPKENTTWYARTKIWSDQDAEKPFWIGFANLSRSYASDTPPAGQWDQLESKVWVNGQSVPAPKWNHPGMKGDLEKPLTNEGYSYRPPTMIRLKKGWNTILIKLPVGSFKGSDWQNPVKWMFTFVPAE